MAQKPEVDAELLAEAFNDALELQDTQRDDFIAHTLETHPELRDDLEELLALATAEPDLTREPHDNSLPPQLGRYQLLHVSGRGGMGVVYRAIDTKLGRPVALKVLPQWIADDPRGLERFEREARLLAQLNDEHIATLHSLEQFESFHFITMEFVEGRKLSDIEVSTLTVQQRLSIGEQIAAALGVAHREGVVHRDLKPSNVMIRPDGRVKVLDFGLAKALGEPAAEMDPLVAPVAPGSTSSQLQGTPDYMSPEQFTGGQVGPQADLWAFGCLLYELFSGQRPFHRSLDSFAHPERLTFDVNWELLPKSLPSGCTTLIHRCLEVDPHTRLADASEAMLTLKHASRNRPRAGRPWLFAAVPLLAAVMTLVVMGKPKPPIAGAEIVDSSTLLAHRVDGTTAWKKIFPVPLDVNPTRPGIDSSPTLVLQNNVPKDVLVSTWDRSSPGTLRLLDASTGKQLWERTATWLAPVNQKSPLRYQWTCTVQDAAGETRILTQVRDGEWYSAALQLCDTDGNTLASYYHPGPLSFFGQIDIDGKRPLLLAGANSSARFVRDLVPFETDRHCVGVILLDIEDLDGQAFPYSSDLGVERDWGDRLPHAHERAYLVIPPIDAETPVFCRSIDIHDATGGRSPSFQVRLTDGRVYTLDAALRPQSLYLILDTPADSFRKAGGTFLPVQRLEHGVPQTLTVAFER